MSKNSVSLTGDTTVRELLLQHPQTYDVFASHGMCDSCRTAPPPVPLHHFSMKHAVELDQLIGELNSAIGGP